MRTLLPVILMLAAYCTCQDMNELNSIAQDVTNSLTADQPGHVQYKMPVFKVIVVESDEFNAFADLQHHVVILNTAAVTILKNDRGELAFLIAHEIGHLQDANCQQRGRAQRLSGIALARMCEAAADAIGIQYMMAAGYSPFDAAGVMGKFMMASGRTSVLGIIFDRFAMDHPVDIDRIRNATNVANKTCRERPEICQ